MCQNDFSLSSQGGLALRKGGTLVQLSRGAAPLCREQPGHLVAPASGEDATWVSSWQGVSRMPNPGGDLEADPGHAGGTMSPS